LPHLAKEKEESIVQGDLGRLQEKNTTRNIHATIGQRRNEVCVGLRKAVGNMVGEKRKR